MINVIRICLVLGCAVFGYLSNIEWLAETLEFDESPWIGMALGLFGGLIFVLLDLFFKQFSVRNILAVILGLAIGLFTHHLVMLALSYMRFDYDTTKNLAIASAILFPYLGVITIFRGQDEFTIMLPFVKLDSKNPAEEIVLLDTSVVIDGRIADIAKTHFISNKLILPGFVLKELQLIADSSDSLKRARGRRGLDILNRIKANPNVDVKINEMDFPEFKGVDAKLVKMAQVIGAKVFTNDYNLNKVAELQGVKVLNINDLANALKPVVIPGEQMQVKLLKEGKENEQAVAYLDDGTMVVVDNGRRMLGQTLNVTITSVLQTQAGRMIFAKVPESAFNNVDDRQKNNNRGGGGNRQNDYRRRK